MVRSEHITKVVWGQLASSAGPPTIPPKNKKTPKGEPLGVVRLLLNLTKRHSVWKRYGDILHREWEGLRLACAIGHLNADGFDRAILWQRCEAE